MKKLLLFTVLLCLLASCSKDEVIEGGRLPIKISVGQQTKANDSQFDTNDKVGIYVVNHTDNGAGILGVYGNHVDNMGFTYGGNYWTPDEPVYWKDRGTPADFYAYYPYSTFVSSIAEHPFCVCADQSQEVDFWASDFLWGKSARVTPSASPVPIVVKHVFSRILVDVIPGEGFTEESWAAANVSVKVVGVKTSSKVDLSTGVAVADGDAGEIIPLLKGKNGTTVSYMAMMVPQEIADNSKLIVISIDGNNYEYRKGFTFRANTQHKFSIAVNKTEGSVNVMIGEWDIDDVVNEGVAEEGVNVASKSQIAYTATDMIVIDEDADFGATIVSHTFENGQGRIVFDGVVTKIGGWALQNNQGLTRIGIPDSVTEIGCCAFYGCVNLSELTIPEGVKYISAQAFLECKSLTSVTIPSTVERLEGNPFMRCEGIVGFYGKYASSDNKYLIDEEGCLHSFAPAGIENYIIPDGVLKIGYESFEGCRRLKSITIPNSVTEIGYRAFDGCQQIEVIDIPNSVTHIGEDAFWCCFSLSGTVTIPASVISVGESVFGGSSNLSGFQGKYASSDNRCLIDNSGNLLAVAPKGLVEYSIPENVVKICAGVFYGAEIKRVVIPSAVREIESLGFCYCANLEEVVCQSVEVPVIDTSNCSAFLGIPTTCILKVPAGCKSKYANSDWNNYFSVIMEIE